MPPTITFVLGLCGSGKSTYVRQRPDRLAFDEGVVPGLPNYEAFLDAVASGRDCIVIDVLYLVLRARSSIRVAGIDFSRGRSITGASRPTTTTSPCPARAAS
jgi:hypothetical protein